MIEALLAWVSTGHERNAKLLAAAAFALLLLAAVGAATADVRPSLATDAERPDGNTLVALQGYQGEGRVIEVTPGGDVVWEYAEGEKFFDVERLPSGNVQLSVAETVPEADCPAAFRDDGHDDCIRNSLRVVDRETSETVWEYAWHDATMHSHELHDADHYTVDGEDRWVLVDMGYDRVFAVDREGEIRWQWNAADTYERPADLDRAGDWTHMNDVDRVAPGVFQVSIRNFDTIVELRVDENGSVAVEPVVGPDDYHERGDPLYEQHNPDRLAAGHVLVADSEHHRVLELDADGRVVWEFGGPGELNWPRDADRLPDGNTLVADSYNDRVVEVNPAGEVVWELRTGRLPYDADRVGADGPREGSADGPLATDDRFRNRTDDAPVGRYVQYGEAMARYVVPERLHGQLLLLAAGLLALVGSGVEGYRWRR